MAANQEIPKKAVTVTPNNSTDLPDGVAYGIFVGTTGSLRVLTAAGDDVTFANCFNGQLIPLQVKRVYATGTTASDIVAMYV